MQSVSANDQLGVHHNSKASCVKLKHGTMVVNQDRAGIVFLKSPMLGSHSNVTRMRHVGQPKKSYGRAQSTLETIVGAIGKF